MLSLVDIRKTYRLGPIDLDVLKGITMTVEKGELLTVIGPSGCGKSTLMHIMGLLEQPSFGSYSIEGTKIAYDNDREISRIRNLKIGFVFQAYHLLPRLTAVENVGIPLAYRGVQDEEIKARSMEYLKKVEMDGRAHHKPNELSGGQNQRVAIARALAGRPSIVLADEPTGALDSRTGREIMGLFKRLNEEEGMTIVVITHDPKIAAQCNRKVEMRDGVIVA